MQPSALDPEVIGMHVGDKPNTERNALAAIAQHLEERDVLSKWDWVTLGCAMLLAAGLAGGGAYYYAKANIVQDSFTRAINRITQDTDAAWCDIANAQIINGQANSKFCAIHMMELQGEEGE